MLFLFFVFRSRCPAMMMKQGSHLATIWQNAGKDTNKNSYCASFAWNFYIIYMFGGILKHRARGCLQKEFVVMILLSVAQTLVFAGFLHLLADVFGNGIDINHVVHGVVGDEGFCHIPNALVIASLTP